MSEEYDEGVMQLDLNRRVSKAEDYSLQSPTDIFQVVTFVQVQDNNIKQWAYLIKTPELSDFRFPASLEVAQLNQQSYYLQPDPKFLTDHPDVETGPTGQPLRREKLNIFWYNVDSFFAPKFGTSLPLYFTFIKIHIFTILLIGSILGIYFCHMSIYYCDRDKFSGIARQVIEQNDKYSQDCCAYADDYFFVSQDFLLMALQQDHSQWTYYGLSLAVYVILIIMPFVHEIILRYYQIKYWQFDPQNNVDEDVRTLYVKHLPRKMTQSEIIKKILMKSKDSTQNSFTEKDFQIEELVFVFDVHFIKDLNTKRQNTFLQLLQINEQIKAFSKEQELGTVAEAITVPALGFDALKDKFTFHFTELMIQTKEIELYLQQGLPFTNKIILKLRTSEQANQVYQLYYRNIWQQIKSKIMIIRKYHKQQQEEDRLRNSSLDQSIKSMNIERQQTDISYDAQISQRTFTDEQDSLPETPNQRKNYEKRSSLKDIVNTELVIQEALNRAQAGRQIQEKEINEEELNQDVHIKRGFREDEIFWMNVGTPSLQRFTIRAVTLTVSILMSGLCMGIFELLFYWQNNPDRKLQIQRGELSTGEKVLVQLTTIFIAFLAIFCTLFVLIMTIRSRRSTYSQQEYNIVNYMSIQQFILILSFPLILVITQWNGLSSTLPIYTVLGLCRTRMIIKFITHLFHVRSVGFFCRKRKIQKKFDGNLYFQGQLNTLMTPELFPIRARMFLIYFVYNTSCLLVFFAPYNLLWSLGFLFFFYFFDKYTVLKVYRIDSQFSFTLFSYLVRSISTVMIPIYIFIFTSLFRERQISINNKPYNVVNTDFMAIFGLWFGISAFFFYILASQTIAAFVVEHCFRKRKSDEPNTNYTDKTYYASYQTYFKSFGIDALTETLTKIFHQIEIKFKN